MIDKRFVRPLLTALFVLGVATSTVATAGEANWTGFYVGINGGGDRGDTTWTNPKGHIDPGFTGGVLGGQFGAQYDINHLVLGAEFQGDGFFGNSGTVTCPNPAFQCTEHVTSEFMATAKVGYAFRDLLPYLKGGIARTYSEGSATPTTPGFDDAKWHDGLVWGGGLDYMIRPNLVLGAEYLHTNLDTQTYGTVCCAYDVSGHTDSFLVHLNWILSPREEHHVPLK